MFGIQNYGAFILAVLVFQMVPGAGTVTILNATARSGRPGGMRAVAGTLAGDFVFMTAAVAGLAAVMSANALVFGGLQLIGAAYLCWLGLRLVFRRSADGVAADVRAGAWDSFRQGFATSLTNPKVMLFFVSFFPQFLRADSSPLTLMVLMAHVTLLSLVWQSALVVVGDRLASRFRASSAFGRVTKKLAGLTLVALGVRLAVSNR